jgi:hypothetical protein
MGLHRHLFGWLPGIILEDRQFGGRQGSSFWVRRRRQNLSAHDIGDLDTQLTPKLANDRWGGEEFPVLSKHDSEYDIWLHEELY